MSEILTEEPAAICSWCGKENSQRLPNCAGCGTRLAAEVEPPFSLDEAPKPKSRLLAICLTLIFGPLGLIYLQAWGTMVLLIALAFPFVLTQKGGLWVTLGARFVSAAMAYSLVREKSTKPNETRDATRLLNAAARLETVNRDEAILAYENIIQLHPDTRASREAMRNIEILKRRVETQY
jgi:hypothetical protein